MPSSVCIGLHVQPVTLAQPGRDRQRPRCVHRRAERAVQHQAPVAELVAEPLDDQGAVVRQVAGRLALVGEVGDQVAGGQLVQAVGAPPGRSRRRSAPLGRPRGRTRRAPGPARPGGPGASPFQNGSLPGWPGAGETSTWSCGDVLDPPGTRAEQEYVADPRLVHHLLVELADPVRVAAAGLALRRSQEHAEQAAVGDGAAAGHGQPLGARPAVQRAGGPVPDQPGPQLGEIVAGIAPGQHVQHGFQHRPGRLGERGGPPDELLQVTDRPVIHRGHRHDLLGQHVERVARERSDSIWPVAHPLRDHRGLHQVALVLGEDHAAGDVAHLVPGAADALQAAGDRGR